ncbi:MAG TPA: amidohydrolase family protein [Steroidobacteraceae bacterium]
MLRAAAVWFSTLAVCVAQAADAARPADVLIHGGLVYTGEEAEPRILDVVLTGDSITYVGTDATARFSVARTIDARGKIVAPGFIDPHTHPDTYIRSDDRAQRRNAPWLMQGVTTIAIGVDGGGSVEVAKQRAWFEERGVGTNLAPYVGFSSVRETVLGEQSRAPDAKELTRMRKLVARAMCEGAFGFSTGLFYAPQSFATTDEVVALAREAGIRGGIYDTHQRDESSYGIGLLNSTREAIDIGRQAGMPVHIAHLKALGSDVHGKAPELVSMIEAARASGLNVTADQYPFVASGSSLQASLLPRWSVDGGRAALLNRLNDADTLQRIRTEMSENLRRRGGADSLLFNSTGRPWSGKTLAAMASLWQLDPVDAALRVIREAVDADSVTSFNMDPEDVKLLMRQPWLVTGSDGSDGHPRQYATFTEKYAKYVQVEQVLTTTEFIRRSTGLTADILGLERRGYLRPGYFADVVVLDPAAYRPKADYIHPKLLSEGVIYLWVNGALAVDAGQLTDALSGKVLSHAPQAGTCK